MEPKAHNEEGDVGAWTLWLILALSPLPGPGAGVADSFGYRDLQGPDRLATVQTWLRLGAAIGPDLFHCPAVDLVGVLMTGLIDTGTPPEDPDRRTRIGLDLCDAMLPRLAPAALVPDPTGRLWGDPRQIPTRLKDAAQRARGDLRRWCAAIADGATESAPCRATRIQFLTLPLSSMTGEEGRAALDAARRRCGNRETSQLAFVRNALAGSDEDFDRARALMLPADLEREPLLAAAARTRDDRLEDATLRARWTGKGDADAGRRLFDDATRARDRDAVRDLAAGAGSASDRGRTLEAVALTRLGLAEEALQVARTRDHALRVHLEAFAALQEALGGGPGADGKRLQVALAALAQVEPSTARTVRFVSEAVAGLRDAYASPDGLAAEADRLAAAGEDLVAASDAPVLDLGVVAAQLYALEAWPSLDRVLDHALRVHPASQEPDVAVAAARVLLLVGARLGDVDRVQQAHALLRHRLTAGDAAGPAWAEAGHLALLAELYLGIRGGASAVALEDLARRLQELDEAAGEFLTSSDRAVLRANLFSLSGATAPSRRRGALRGLWEARPGRPLTLLLTALDRWYDARYLEAALVLRLMSRTGCGGSLTPSAVEWRAALRRRSGAPAGPASTGSADGDGTYRILVDGDLRTRITMGWDGRMAVEIHPADRILILPSPPGDAGTL